MAVVTASPSSTSSPPSLSLSFERSPLDLGQCHLLPAPRPALQTPFQHIYRFPTKKPREGISPIRTSIYVPGSSPAPPPPPPPLSLHPAFRNRRANHTPILITQDVINSVLKKAPVSPQNRRPEAGAGSFAPFQALRAGTLSPPESPIESRARSPGRPRHKPIVIPDFALPDRPPIESPPKPRHKAIVIPDSVLPRGSTLDHSLCPLNKNPRISEVTTIFTPITPTDSDCETPRASVIHIRAPDLSPKQSLLMSRPTTGHGAASRAIDASATHGDGQGSHYDGFATGADPATSQHSFASDLGQDEQLASSRQREGRPSIATVYGQQHQSAKTVTSPADNRQVTAQAAAAPTNLSGLVCNVHRCTGKEPRGLVGATTTILGDKLYVFGGRSLSRRRPHMTADLYELDLIQRHWTKVRTSGQLPSPRYFHSVCGLGDSKLICYGGMSPVAPQSQQTANSADQPDVVVMSDVHIYDTKARIWTHIPTQDTPQGRYAHCAAVLPSTAVFTSSNAPLSAIHNNPSDENPNQGSIGISLDGSGGAEMVVVGGQDNANHYIEQISVFNLRSLKWTATNSLGRSCGAYRSVVAPLLGLPASKIGQGAGATNSRSTAEDANSMLIYSNYNFLDVKLELQVRTQDGVLTEKLMSGPLSPPGLRFPNGGVLNNHFVISGTYLTSSRQEYALWALDLRTMNWSRIDVGGSVFGQGSWNRGVLWPRRNTFVILGNRKRNLVEDYNHRRINFSNICLVELEAFGLYDNPRYKNPTSAYQSYSAPELPPSVRPKATLWTGGGRPHFTAAEELGKLALSMKELADMDILALGGERIPVNSSVLAKRWGAYFVQIMKQGTTGANGTLGNPDESHLMDSSDATAVRNPSAFRNSSMTITPSIATGYTTATTLTSGSSSSAGGRTLTGSSHAPSSSVSTAHTNGTSINHAYNDNVNTASPKPFHPPTPISLPSAARSRVLYLPHTAPTIQAILHFLYTCSLPPPHHPLCAPQVLCSLLQIARPYAIDGLLEATLTRLHEGMDGRNAAAVFNACAMAAGGGRGTGFGVKLNGLEHLVAAEGIVDAHGTGQRNDSVATSGSRNTILGPSDLGIGLALNGMSAVARERTGSRADSLSEGPGRRNRLNANGVGGVNRGRLRSESVSTDVSTDDEAASGTDTDGGGSTTDGSELWEEGNANHKPAGRGVDGGSQDLDEEIWAGERSCVIGLQKRGLRGLMEGRRMRERSRGVAIGDSGI